MARSAQSHGPARTPGCWPSPSRPRCRGRRTGRRRTSSGTPRSSLRGAREEWYEAVSLTKASRPPTGPRVHRPMLATPLATPLAKPWGDGAGWGTGACRARVKHWARVGRTLPTLGRMAKPRSVDDNIAALPDPRYTDEVQAG